MAHDTHYTFDTHYQRYKCFKYDYTTKQWILSAWMPAGFQPPPPQQPHQPQQQQVQSYEEPPTTPQFSRPVQSQADSAYGSSPISPPQYGQGATYGSGSPAAAGPSHSQSFNSFAEQLYGPASTAQQPNQSSQWSNSTPLPGYIPQAGPSSNVQPNQIRPMPKGKGGELLGTYSPPSNTLHYEKVDVSYYVRPKAFFFEGRVFAVIMNETAGSNSTTPAVTDYNSSPSINAVKYKDNYVYTNVRRFVVVRQRREFCYACPIFTYSGKATTKRGVRPSEHGIAHSWGQEPQLLRGEAGLTKPPISVVMAEDVPELHVASRIYYGIHHPIQYNVKVKEIGYVPHAQIPRLQGNWKEEDDSDTEQPTAVTNNAEIPEEDDEENVHTQAGAQSENVVMGQNAAGNVGGGNPDVNDLAKTFSNTTLHGGG